MRLLSLALLASLALGSTSFAAEDAETGLGVDLGDDFVVDEIAPIRPYAANFGVKSASGDPANFEGEEHLCQVSFAPVAANAGLTQTEINEMATSPEWLQMAKDSMSSALDFEDDSPFELAGYNGHEFVAVPKQSGSEDVRLVLSTVETAKGRTAVSCVTHADNLDEVLPVFRAIRAGVTPPA